MRRFSIAWVVVILSCMLAQGTRGGHANAADPPAAGKQVEKTVVSRSDPTQRMGYLLFLPGGYGKQNKAWPLILFLHGAGERGEGNLALVKKHGPPKIVENKPAFPFIVVSPQCPKQRRWTDAVRTSLLVQLVDEISEKFNVDGRRVYLTGLSMGGSGSWGLAAHHADRFAAAVPICGGGDPATARDLKSVPIWAFHGAKDRGVPLRRSEEMVDAVNKAGGHAKLTVYPEAGHDAWTVTYDNPGLYAWLLSQTRPAPKP